jgi:hypothetical protein
MPGWVWILDHIFKLHSTLELSVLGFFLKNNKNFLWFKGFFLSGDQGVKGLTLKRAALTF